MMNILRLTFIVCILRIRLLYGQTKYSGKIVEAGEYPFVVAMFLSDSTPLFHHCLGTILSPHWILTDSDCFSEETREHLIKHGAWWENETQKLTQVSDNILHSSIRLLRTEIPLKFDSFTQAVKLIPQSKQIPSNIQPFTVVFGSVKGLEVYNNTTLENTRANFMTTEPSFNVTHSTLGAPLMYNGEQIGVLLADNDDKFYYSNLSVHLDWIYRTINFYEFKEELSYLKNVQPNCTGTPDSNDILDICCTYPFGYGLLDLCISLE